MNAAVLSNEEAIQVSPLSAHIGAEISGVDLTRPLNAQQVGAIRAALFKWRVIFFREQFLSHEQHVAFSAQFGELTVGHPVFGHVEGHPEIYSISKFRKATRFDGQALLRPWTGWHTDVTAAVNPPFASILRGVTIPPYGGDTQWTNLVIAYEKLSAPLRRFRRWLARRAPVHAAGRRARHGTHLRRPSQERALVAEHPLVRVHPETGERGVVCQPQFPEDHCRRDAAREPGAARVAVGARDAAGIHCAVQMGAGQRRVLGQPVDRASRTLRYLRSRLRPATLSHDAGRGCAGRAGRTRFGRDRRFAVGAAAATALIRMTTAAGSGARFSCFPFCSCHRQARLHHEREVLL